ncbi:response regulator [Magnetofaba australis]|uniref:Putative two component transcriptional regulator n=1 Tax=Magnetofaba australis IT-1 TaxID=1434232 RepID=A0A1Y2K7H7_9PROT|nr:response regulator [Magnetofaba australis]OSM05277.1 putative two component transcriptional regulator [Magnetofaba australis IT-1]
MSAKETILVVEDDDQTRELLQDYLQKNGFACIALPDGEELWPSINEHMPDLLVLDVMLPGDDGLTLCRNLRADPKTAPLPIIMLTARTEETDRIIGLEMGADDYLPKPFNPRELLARISSVLRRARAEPVVKGRPAAKALLFADWRLDLASRRLTAPSGVLISLSKKEYALLTIFLNNPQEVLDRDRIMNAYVGRDASPFERGIDVQIGRLRKRLREGNPDGPELIATVWGQGYMLDCPVEESA